jgi:hypothetical protein
MRICSLLPSATEIDGAVRAAVADGTSLYALDERLLDELTPDVILTQDLCTVCAVSGDDVATLCPVGGRRPTAPSCRRPPWQSTPTRTTPGPRRASPTASASSDSSCTQRPATTRASRRFR